MRSRDEIRTNWADSHRIQANRIVAAESVAEAQDLVARSAQVRALGTRHSFNSIIDGDDVLLLLTDLPPEVEIDSDARTARVGAGATYGAVAAGLERAGWALHNLGSLPHISVAGAVSTGTHGSGVTNGALATAVRALETIAPDGSLRTVTAGDPDFDGSVVALGALGPVVRATLSIEPTYRVRQDVYGPVSWDDGLAHFTDLVSAAYSVSLFTRWQDVGFDEVWLKTRLDDGDDGVMPDELYGAGRVPGDGIVGSGDNTTRRDGVPGPWLERLPHFRIDARPSSSGDEIQTEYFVAMADGPAALLAVRELGEGFEGVLLASEIRTIASDSLWMSPFCGRASVAIHFTWRNRPDRVRALVRRIEQALAPFAPRTHWGKNFVDPAIVARPLPRCDDFVRLVRRVDPGGKFQNAYLRTFLPG